MGKHVNAAIPGPGLQGGTGSRMTAHDFEVYNGVSHNRLSVVLSLYLGTEYSCFAPEGVQMWHQLQR